jgi:hypothetical protein
MKLQLQLRAFFWLGVSAEFMSVDVIGDFPEVEARIYYNMAVSQYFPIGDTDAKDSIVKMETEKETPTSELLRFSVSDEDWRKIRTVRSFVVLFHEVFQLAIGSRWY